MTELLLDFLHVILTALGYLLAFGIFASVAFALWAATWIYLYTEPRKRIRRVERQHAAYMKRHEWASADEIRTDIEARHQRAVRAGILVDTSEYIRN